MSEPVIQVRGLGKMYKLGATLSHDTLRDHITAAARSLWRGIKRASSPQRHEGTKVGLASESADAGDGPPLPQADDQTTTQPSPPPSPFESSSLRGDTDPADFWALKDVSFDVHEGEVVGIIGRNGAGKSTLLKILSQITEPTEGEVRIRGRVASLLEVGTGFHPELSGRENIYLNGAILGMTRKEIRAKFDEIVAFAEVEKFIDTPVKRYSSGMYVRLAFAVAAHLEPEILLVDEVLAVGDVQFQKKCLGKMGEVAKGGRTVLFVSHNMAAVRKLCPRALLIDRGEVHCDDQSDASIEAYLDARTAARGKFRFAPAVRGPGWIESAEVQRPADGQLSFELTEEVRFGVEVRIREPVNAYLAALIHDRLDNPLMLLRDHESCPELSSLRRVGLYSYEFAIPAKTLVPGQYSIELALVRREGSVLSTLHRPDGRPSFTVIDTRSAKAKAGLPWNSLVAIQLGLAFSFTPDAAD